jgi:hypothetical protein
LPWCSESEAVAAQTPEVAAARMSVYSVMQGKVGNMGDRMMMLMESVSKYCFISI